MTARKLEARKTKTVKKEQRKRKPAPLPKKIRKKRALGKKRIKHRKKIKTVFLELIVSTVIALCIIYLASLFTFLIPRVEGFGMTPLLKEPDRIFVNRLGKVKRFSLVYFHVPNRSNEVSTRRIIGFPGEKVVYKEDVLLINGQEKVERFLSEKLRNAKKEGYQLTEDFSTENISGAVQGRIPEGKYLVLGDNRSFATDSRYYGLVDEKEIIGVASMKLLPLHEMMKL